MFAEMQEEAQKECTFLFGGRMDPWIVIVAQDWTDYSIEGRYGQMLYADHLRNNVRKVIV